MAESILAKLEKKIDAANQRHQAAQDNLQRIAAEKRELDAAYRVLTQLLDEEAKAGSIGATTGEELSRPKLALKILEESPHGLRPSEIKGIASKKYGRELPTDSLSAALTYHKKSGLVTNKDGLWSIVSTNETASGEETPEAPSSDGSMSAELALPSS